MELIGINGLIESKNNIVRNFKTMLSNRGFHTVGICLGYKWLGIDWGF